MADRTRQVALLFCLSALVYAFPVESSALICYIVLPFLSAMWIVLFHISSKKEADPPEELGLSWGEACSRRWIYARNTKWMHQ